MNERDEAGFEDRWRSAGANDAELSALAKARETKPLVSRKRFAVLAERAGEKKRALRIKLAAATVVFAGAAIAAPWIADEPETPVSESPVIERPVIERSPEPVVEPSESEPVIEAPPVPKTTRPRVVTATQAPVQAEEPQKIETPKEPEDPPKPRLRPQPPERGSSIITEHEPAKPIFEERAPEISLYRKALERLRAKDPEEAAELFREYLDQYPRGTLRDEAELSLIEALFLAGEDEELEERATRWIQIHPQHPRTEDVRRILRAKKF